MYFQKVELKSGVRWKVTIDLPADPVTGKRRQKRITAATKKEAERLARETLHAIEHGGYTDRGDMLLAMYLEQWLEDFGRQAWELTTFDRNAQLVRRHIIPSIGHIKLDKLTAADVQRLYRSKLEGGRLDGKPGGLSPRTVKYIHTMLHQALSHAMKYGLIVRNVADAVDTPKQRKRDMRVWDESQIATFLEAASESRYFVAYALAIYTGLRKGELLGLRWSDIDLERGEIALRQALKDNQGQLYFGQPKRHRSRRPIALSAEAVAMLKRHKIAQNQERLKVGEAWADLDLVFATELGAPIHPSNFARTYRAIVKRAGLPYIRPHDLRHSHATMLLAAGVHAKIISERLGHASVAFTMDVYSHVLPDMQREAADQLDTLIQMPERKRM